MIFEVVVVVVAKCWFNSTMNWELDVLYSKVLCAIFPERN